MMYRKLGGTNLEISVICLGPMRWAAKESGDDDKAKAGEMALRRALDAGVNFLHSSYEYGTRWMMGRVLKGHPKRGELHHIIKVPVPDFNRFQHGFSHIFAGGYAAGYYSYKWAEVLAADAFSRFEKAGIFDKQLGEKFLKCILQKGGSDEALNLFIEFQGREPSVDALLQQSGIFY